MNEVEQHLTEVYGFERNNWGFLSGTIEDVEYTLMHDPLGGYSVQYTFISGRQAGNGIIKLGKKLSMDAFTDAVKKIYGIK